MRTLLTMLGMIIGVAAVISALSITNGAKTQIENQIASMGGARGKDILVQFLIEAMTLSAIGGLGGMGAGLGGSHLVSSVMSWPTLTPPSWLAVALIFSTVVGMVSGFYAAWKASKLDPIDALRYE